VSWKKALGVGLILSTVLALAACGGTTDGDGAEVASLDTATTETQAEAETDTTTTSDDPQELLLDYTECMREEGIDLPDPEFSGGGGRGRVIIGPGDVDPDDPDFQAAQEKCGAKLEGLRQNFDEEDRQAMQDAALEFAKCMREHGIDMPDPDFSDAAPGRRGSGGAFRFGGAGIDPDDPDFQKAREACDEAFADLPGRFGRGPGGGDE
jgi:hypothetical protein